MERILVWMSGVLCAAAIASAAPFPAPTVDAPKAAGKNQTVVLAGGCFWGVEAVFDAIAGVDDAIAGYAGGPANKAQYEVVSTGTTGHAESVKITYDPSKISYGKLLQVYFSVVHDPTELNRQGPDTGTQYRSTIFYANDEQKHIAEAYIAQLDQAKVFPKPIVTTLEPLKGFYKAEEYHQDFMKKNPDYPYIVINDKPKLKHLKEQYPELVKGGSK
jgi:peptide-methionine (S)-S-oxide reductase